MTARPAQLSWSCFVCKVDAYVVQLSYTNAFQMINDKLQEFIDIQQKHPVHVNLNFVMQDAGLLEIDYDIQLTATRKRSKHPTQSKKKKSVHRLPATLTTRLKGHPVLLDLQSKEDFDALTAIIDKQVVLNELENVAMLNGGDDFYADFINFVTLKQWCNE